MHSLVFCHFFCCAGTRKSTFCTNINRFCLIYRFFNRLRRYINHPYLFIMSFRSSINNGRRICNGFLLNGSRCRSSSLRLICNRLLVIRSGCCFLSLLRFSFILYFLIFRLFLFYYCNFSISKN